MKGKDKKRVLCMFDYGKNVNTGFSRQTKEIVKAVKKHYGSNLTLDIVGINYFPQFDEKGQVVWNYVEYNVDREVFFETIFSKFDNLLAQLNDFKIKITPSSIDEHIRGGINLFPQIL